MLRSLSGSWNPTSPWQTPVDPLVCVSEPPGERFVPSEDDGLTRTLRPSAPAETEPEHVRPPTLARMGLAAIGAVMLVGCVSPSVPAAVGPASEVAVSTTMAPGGTTPSTGSISTAILLSSPNVPTFIPLPDPPPPAATTAAVATATAVVAVTVSNPDRYQISGVIEDAAKRNGVPPDLLKAVLWQETGWKHVENGAVTSNVNRDSKGRVLSTDWGIAQINDRAQPLAFPRARNDYKFNIDYGAKLLSWLHKENGRSWNRTMERYNGISPRYRRAIQRHMRVRPWEPGVLQDRIERLKAEAPSSERDQQIASLQQRLQQEQHRISALGKARRKA